MSDNLPAPIDEPGHAPELKPSARRKAAIMTLALGPERSAEIFRHLRPEEIAELVLEIAALQQVSADEKQAVLEEFWAASQAQDFVAQGAIDYAKEVLERPLGDQQAVEIMA